MLKAGIAMRCRVDLKSEHVEPLPVNRELAEVTCVDQPTPKGLL